MDVATYLSAGAIILSGIFAFFVKRTVNDYDEKFKVFAEKMEVMETQIVTATLNHNKDMNDLKYNYLDRFNILEKQDVESTNKILEALHKIEMKIEKQEQFCYLIQKQKGIKKPGIVSLRAGVTNQTKPN